MNWYNKSIVGHFLKIADLVELLIQSGATDFDRAMGYAAKNGHKDIVELLEKAKSSQQSI